MSKTAHKTTMLAKRPKRSRRHVDHYGSLKYSKQDVAIALKVNRGFKSHAAKALGCTAKTIDEYIERYPDLLRVIEAAKEAGLDDAESSMFDHMDDGNWKATQFYLATQGKSRGYGQETEKVVAKTYNIKLPDNFPVPTLDALRNVTPVAEAIDVDALEVNQT